MAVDLSRETAQIRNSHLPGANWLASGFTKIQTGFREIPKPTFVIVEVSANYTAKFDDYIIINTSVNPITVTFPVEAGQQSNWFVLATANKGTVNLAAARGQVLGAQNVPFGQTGLVVSDGNNLICGN